MDELRGRLAEAAERAAQQARAPGAAVTLRRARARRRRAAGTVCALVVVAVAAGIALARGGLEFPTVEPSSGHQDLPWRPLAAPEWAGTVPEERPVDPVLAAAQGERAGQPWRLVVYRSTHRPSRNAGGGEDVCYILEWFLQVEWGRNWRVHGTCAPQAQTTTALAAAGPDRASTAVLGRAPPTAARVRLELRGHGPVETATVDTGGSLGRFYVAFVPTGVSLERMAFVPPGTSLERVVALDDQGREVGQAPGLGPLELARSPAGYPPTGPVTVVTQASGRAGPLQLIAWPTRYGYCLEIRGGGSSGCSGPDSTANVLAPHVHCSASGVPSVKRTLVVGGVPTRAARTVRVEAAGRRVEVPATDAGEQLDRAFFVAELPLTRWPSSVRLTALDGRGASVGTWNLPGCG